MKKPPIHLSSFIILSKGRATSPAEPFPVGQVLIVNGTNERKSVRIKFNHETHERGVGLTAKHAK